MSCTGCFESVINSCGDFSIKAGLTAATSYYVILTKPGKSNVYQRQYTTDVDGVLTVNKADFPDGYFSPLGGPVKLQLKKTTDYSLETFIIGGMEYDCVLISFSQIDTEEGDTSPISVIQ